MSIKLTSADERKLVGVNYRLVAVVRRVAQSYQGPGRFAVIEGVRTKARQRALVAKGASRTMNSKHLVGRAVDVVPVIDGRVSWNWADYRPLVECAKRVSADMGIPLTFGYDWGWDAPHWEMKEP